ncbi:MAG: hypothetical protein R3E13_09555 [Alphaproteobacteria bacterium]
MKTLINKIALFLLLCLSVGFSPKSALALSICGSELNIDVVKARFFDRNDSSGIVTPLNKETYSDIFFEGLSVQKMGDPICSGLRIACDKNCMKNSQSDYFFMSDNPDFLFCKDTGKGNCTKTGEIKTRGKAAEIYIRYAGPRTYEDTTGDLYKVNRVINDFNVSIFYDEKKLLLNAALVHLGGQRECMALEKFYKPPQYSKKVQYPIVYPREALKLTKEKGAEKLIKSYKEKHNPEDINICSGTKYIDYSYREDPKSYVWEITIRGSSEKKLEKGMRYLGGKPRKTHFKCLALFDQQGQSLQKEFWKCEEP